MPAAAAETLIIGGDQHVAASDEFFGRRHAVIGPRITAEQKVFVQRLRRIRHLGRAAILRRPGGAVRPRHDRAAAWRRLAGRRDQERRDHGFAVGDVGRDIGDAPGLRAGDRRRHSFLHDDIAKLSVGNDFGDGLIERRQRHAGPRRRRSGRQQQGRCDHRTCDNKSSARSRYHDGLDVVGKTFANTPPAARRIRRALFVWFRKRLLLNRQFRKSTQRGIRLRLALWDAPFCCVCWLSPSSPLPLREGLASCAPARSEPGEGSLTARS